MTHESDEENSAVQPDPVAHRHHGMPKRNRLYEFF